MADIKVTNVPDELKAFLKGESSLRHMSLSEIVIEALNKAHPKLPRRKEKANA